MASLPTIVASDLPRLSAAGVNESKLRLTVFNGHMPSFRFVSLKNVVRLVQCSGVIVTSIQVAVAQVGQVCLVFVVGAMDESDC